MKTIILIEDHDRMRQGLALSLRTIENHLGSIYGKLGIPSRRDLERL
jgi:DNA-binding NarL/FixJ family response regulator